MSEWTNVAPAGEFGPGEHRVIDIDDVAVAVFNLDGEYFAVEDVCTHDFGTLTGGCVEDGRVMCPRHGAWFDIRLRAGHHVSGAHPRRSRAGARRLNAAPSTFPPGVHPLPNTPARPDSRSPCQCRQIRAVASRIGEILQPAVLLDCGQGTGRGVAIARSRRAAARTRSRITCGSVSRETRTPPATPSPRRRPAARASRGSPTP